MADFTISLKAARVNAEMSTAEVAQNTGFSESAIRSWETGRHKVAYENLLILAKEYRCPVALIRTPNSSQ